MIYKGLYSIKYNYRLSPKGGREAGGLRQSALKELTSDEIKYIKSEFSEIGGDPNKLRFNKGSSTSYRDDIDAINIRGDIFQI